MIKMAGVPLYPTCGGTQAVRDLTCRAPSRVGPLQSKGHPLQTSVLLLLEPAQLMDITPGGGGTAKQLMTGMEKGKRGHLGWTAPRSAASQRGFIVCQLPLLQVQSPGQHHLGLVALGT